MLTSELSDTDENSDNLKSKRILSISDIQRIRIDRLMASPDKPANIPDRRQMRMPRAFEPHEYVRNVMGASAGAGSGEFDIYRGCRRRQRIRQDFMYYQEKQKLANDEWQRSVQQRQDQFDARTAKKRQKHKMNKRAKKLDKEDEDSDDNCQDNS